MRFRKGPMLTFAHLAFPMTGFDAVALQGGTVCLRKTHLTTSKGTTELSVLDCGSMVHTALVVGIVVEEGVFVVIDDVGLAMVAGIEKVGLDIVDSVQGPLHVADIDQVCVGNYAEKQPVVVAVVVVVVVVVAVADTEQPTGKSLVFSEGSGLSNYSFVIEVVDLYPGQCCNHCDYGPLADS